MCDANTPTDRDKVTKEVLAVLGITVGDVLGAGTYGKVLAGTQTSTKKILAIKVQDLRKRDEDFRMKFMATECEVSMKVRHPNLVRTFDVRVIGTQLVFIMERAKMDLHKYFELYRRSSEKDQVRITVTFMLQITSGLDYLHSKPLCIAHRDIKPENILLDYNGVAKLSDFGVCTHSGPGRMSETYCGTPGYISPQIEKNQKYCALKADIFALGRAGFWMSRGKEHPFSREVKSWFGVKDEGSVALREMLERMMDDQEDRRPGTKLVLAFLRKQ